MLFAIADLINYIVCLLPEELTGRFRSQIIDFDFTTRLHTVCKWLVFVPMQLIGEHAFLELACVFGPFVPFEYIVTFYVALYRIMYK